MLKHKKLLLFFFVIPAVAIVIALWYFHSIRIIRLDHEGFTLWLDCGRRGAVKFRYVAKADKGNLDRLHMFSFDPQVSADCQQTSTALYVYPGVHYDRGHLVPANHFDHSLKALKQTNYITNILPMTLEVNRGAWLRTEELIECYRDQSTLLVVGGVIWGSNKADDYFLKSHTVATPDAFWKVVLEGTERVIAWIVPNTKEATRAHLDNYLISVADLEKRIGEKIDDVPVVLKKSKSPSTWPLSAKCNKS